jgi:adenylate kinase family enzyme
MKTILLIAFSFFTYSSFGGIHSKRETKEERSCFFAVGTAYDPYSKRFELFISSVGCLDNYNELEAEKIFVESVKYRFYQEMKRSNLIVTPFNSEQTALNFRSQYIKKLDDEGKTWVTVRLLSSQEVEQRLVDRRMEERRREFEEEKQRRGEEFERQAEQNRLHIESKQRDNTLLITLGVIALCVAVGLLAR